MRRSATSFRLFFFTAVYLTLPQALAARDLTFAERVAAQDAIERTKYAHRVGASKPYDVAVPREVLERKVRNTLALTVALEELWQTPISPEMLRRELKRMGAQTRMPDRLEELFAALGYDSFLIQESLVRSVLVDRLAHNLFEDDSQIHADAFRAAKTLREQLISGDLDPSHPHPARRVTTLLRLEDGEQLEPQMRDRLEAEFGGIVLGLRGAEFDRRRGFAQGRPGQIGPVVAGVEAFTISVPLEARANLAVIAAYSASKRAWDEWWSEQSSTFFATTVSAVAEQGVPLPVSGEDCSGENWDTEGLLEVPLRRSGHTAIWTGSEMLVWGGADSSYLTKTGSRYDPDTDSWTTMSAVGAPSARGGHSAVWTGDRMVIWGASTPFGGVSTNTGGRYDPATDTWLPTSLTGVPIPRSDPSGIWTGSVVVFWGGYVSGDPDGCNCCSGGNGMGCDNQTCEDAVCAVDSFCCAVEWDPICDDEAQALCTCCGTSTGPTNSGGRYDPVADTWTPTKQAGGPSPRSGHTAVWTGEQMIAWGGFATAEGLTNTGGHYDPVLDQWSSTPTFGAPIARYNHSAVWTGSEMIVWGGVGDASYQFTGGRYNPSTSSWLVTEPSTAPTARGNHTAIWTGDEMIIWGGLPIPETGNDAARYDPATNSWSDTTSEGAPAARRGHSAVWTGSEMIVFGGDPNYVNGYYELFNSGGRYDPAADSWTPTFASGTPQARAYHTAVWSGNEMIVWSGATNLNKTLQLSPTGGRYDPATHSWSPTSLQSVPDKRWAHTAVWTGDEMIVWGGDGDDLSLLISGGRYEPISDSWTSTAILGAPQGRRDHTAIWNGSRMIVWGGWGLGQQKNDGRLYDPSDDSWTSMTSTGAPAAREQATAVWTGSRMIVWGGYNQVDSYLDTGGVYDSTLNSWEATTVPGAPQGRYKHAAVWTGDRMIVWGGYVPGGTNSGASYDPEVRSWTPTSLNGAPTARHSHTAVWTGREMIVWGGTGDDSGGRYDPTVDAWMPTTTTDAPKARSNHTAVWTGEEMIVWGGGTVVGDGALYDPDGEDLDGDEYGCAIDCNDADPNVFSEPHEVTGVAFEDGHTLQWPSLAATTGTSTGYDIARGLQSELPAGGGASESCVASDYSPPPGLGTNLIKLEDTDEPLTGQGFWYLIRGVNPCGTGSYGATSQDEERTTAVCP